MIPNSVNYQKEDEEVYEIFPKPPEFIYKQFESGPNALSPPDIEKIKIKTKTYWFFGQVFRFDFTEPTLDKFGVEQLFDPAELPDKYQELLEKLALSFHESSLQLLEFCRKNPSSVNLKVEDLRLISNNMFYILNNLRSKQSLVYLEEKLKYDIKKRRSAINKINRRIKSLLALVS